MSVPDYQSLMKPLLEAIADGQEHRMRDVIERIADRLGLTEEDRSQRIPSGAETLLSNRMWWAQTYLFKAGLIERPRRGWVRLTDKGREVLRENPDRIDVAYLKRFEEFEEFLRSGRSGGRSEKSGEMETPEDALATAYEQYRAAITSELLDRVRNLPPQAFERLVLDVLLAMGYGGSDVESGELTKATADGGIDGIIKQDRLGLDNIYLQAKRWGPGQPVGREEIQKFVGALAGIKEGKGVFITTSTFTKGAVDYVRSVTARVVLIDGEKLAELMFEHGVGVSVVRRYEIKRIDSDYFSALAGEYA